MSAAAAAAAVKQEPASAPEDSKEAAQGELEAREQLAKRDSDLARERAACLKLQRCAAALLLMPVPYLSNARSIWHTSAKFVYVSSSAGFFQY